MKKVVVAMSGGIDSTVAALILKEQGFDVLGIHLRLFSDNSIKCCGSDESQEIFKKVCNHIGIRYYVKDARKIFKGTVINNFVKSYISGKTPNPCVECNRFLKFSYLFDIANSIGAELIATGHYARIEKEGNRFFIKRGVDSAKDQSYFLYSIEEKKLKNILFPVGGFLKSQIKEIALKNKIPIDTNKESKDICFIPDGNYSLFLKRNGYVKNIEGYIRDTSGKILARHNGYFHFTIGQRKRLGFSGGKRLYVADIIPEKNEVIVGELNEACKKRIIIKDMNLFCEIKDGSVLYAQVRYRHTPSRGVISFISENKSIFEFFEPQFALTPGQSCVFYEGDKVLGGGVIEKVID